MNLIERLRDHVMNERVKGAYGPNIVLEEKAASALEQANALLHRVRPHIIGPEKLPIYLQPKIVQMIADVDAYLAAQEDKR